MPLTTDGHWSQWAAFGSETPGVEGEVMLLDPDNDW